MGYLGFIQGVIEKPSFAIKNDNLKNIVSAFAGAFHSIFVDIDSNVWCCGDNSYGQLGLGEQLKIATIPIKNNNLQNIISLYAGELHSVFIDNDNNIFMCGKTNRSANNKISTKFIPFKMEDGLQIMSKKNKIPTKNARKLLQHSRCRQKIFYFILIITIKTIWKIFCICQLN